jgi:RES domain-containing protein
VTLTVYRLGKQAHRAGLFSGQGGVFASGRWTPRGRPVVYTSASISLAILEYTVNYRRRGWVPATVLGRVTIPSRVRVQTVSAQSLLRDWHAADAPLELQKIGGEWLERGETAVLKVPSAVVVEEYNYLLNPLHADFGRFIFGAAKTFSFDRRVTRTRKSSLSS